MLLNVKGENACLPYELTVVYNDLCIMTRVFVDQIQPVLVAVQVRRHLDLEGVPLLSRTKSCLKAQESKKMSAHSVMSYCRVVKTDCPEFHPYSAVLIINIKYSTFYKKVNVIYSSIILL